MRRGDGLRLRLARVPGQTPKGLLAQPFYFPGVLSSLDIDEEAAHTEYDTVAAGRFSQAARPASTLSRRTRRAHRGIDESPDLRRLEVQTLAMDWDAAWLVETGVRPEDMDRVLFGVLRSKRPVELLAALDLKAAALGTSELRMFATIRSVRRSLPESEVDTRRYTISFVEWRDPSAGRSSTGEGRKRGVHLPARHKLVADDTLSSLARDYYHRHDGWRSIAERNGIRGWGQNTALVKSKRFKVGDAIVIPKVTFARPPGERHGPTLPVSSYAPVVGE